MAENASLQKEILAQEASENDLSEVSSEEVKAPDAAEITESEESEEVVKAGRIKSIASVGSIVALLIFALVVIYIIPPLGSQPVSQTSEEQFFLNRKIELVSAGNAEKNEYRYQNIENALEYQFFIHEENDHAKGEHMVTEFRGKLTLAKGSATVDRSVYFSFDDVSVSVKDGEKDIELIGVGDLMKGIILEGRLDPQTGIGRLIPLVNINPQVGRVLYIVMDVLRYAWISLPESPVGMAGSWRTIDKSAENEVVTVTSIVRDSYFDLSFDDKVGDANIGKGNAQLKLRDGRVSELKGSLHAETAEMQNHSVAFSLSLQGIKEN